MYISKRIYIECMALIEHCKSVPFLWSHWSKFGYQVYATENRVNWNNVCTALVGDSLLLTAVRVNDGLELEVMDPKEHKGDVEQEEG